MVKFQHSTSKQEISIDVSKLGFKDEKKVAEYLKVIFCESSRVMDAEIDITEYTDDVIDLEKGKNLVFLLESPHKKEFEDYSTEESQLVPIKAARGNANTGIKTLLNDSKLLQEIIKKYNIKTMHIINVMQYQMSLDYLYKKVGKAEDITVSGKKISSKKIKIKLFKMLWENEVIREDLKQRIDSANPAVLINGCTKLDKFKEEILTPWLQEEFAEKVIYSINHPSSIPNYNFKKI